MAITVDVGDIVEHSKFGQGAVREVNPPRRRDSKPTILVDEWTVHHAVTREYSRRGRGWLRNTDSHVNISSVRVVRKRKAGA
jgi:hypothetical protein